VRLLVDEECDDGNRRDGDGCSADCMDVDAMVDPCPVWLPQTARALTIDQTTGVTYVATDTQLLRMVVTLEQGVELVRVADRVIDSMLAADNKIYVFGQGSLGVYENSAFAIIMDQQTDVGFWVLFKYQPHFITRKAGNLWLINCATRQIKTYDNPSAQFIACNSDSTQQFIKCNVADGYYQLNNVTAPTLVPYTPEAYPSNVWLRAYMTVMESTVSQFFFPISAPDLRGAPSAYTIQLDREIIVSSDILAVSKSNVRALLSPDLPSVFQTKPIQAVGNQLLTNVTNSLDFNCYIGEKCFLDISVSLYGDPRSETTYFAELSNALASNVTNAMGTFSKKLRESRYFAATVAQDPKSKALLVLSRNRLFYIGRRGATIQREDGTCIPYEVKVCPVGQWGDSHTACTACSNSSGVQCKGTQARRRLLQASYVTVTTTIDLDDAKLKAVFSQAEVASGKVTVVTSDPRQALQNMYATIAANPQWVVVSKPTALYIIDSVSSGTSAVDVIVGGAIGGMAVVVFVLVLLWWYWDRIYVVQKDHVINYKLLN